MGHVPRIVFVLLDHFASSQTNDTSFQYEYLHFCMYFYSHPLLTDFVAHIAHFNFVAKSDPAVRIPVVVSVLGNFLPDPDNLLVGREWLHKKTL